MLFHTWTFILFFLIVYPVYLLVKGSRLRLPWLLAASYVFYGCWNPLYLVLIFYATTLDYLAVMGMSTTRWKKPWLALSIVNNLGLLGFFKYGRFVVENLNALLFRLGFSTAVAQPDVSFISETVNRLLAAVGISYSIDPLPMLLPVGISFYVFQSMSYTIDYYRGNVQREPNFIRYATFVSLFPQLVAGPIERAKNLLPQLQRAPNISRSDVADGLSLFVVGLFKKVALADYLSLYVEQVYGSPQTADSPALVLATIAFGWQIYFDFSGYTDMARGVARMMGIHLMLNFNNPYLATGLGDFWRRWHISLSSWFRDYVYIPLGGNRGGTFSTYRNLCIAMVVSGLWHGAMWTFVAWGAVHAAGYAATRRLEATAFYRRKVPALFKRVWVFSFVSFAWVFFRAESMADAATILKRIFTSAWTDPALPLLMAVLVLSVWLYQAIYESKLRALASWTPVRIGLVVAMLLYVALVAGANEQAFIYFQF
jgi:D-alanyl-lipoteichoic acid acyltransferase DltB (MBOAT superfamily)